MLKGIEAQLMVTRTADLSRDANALQRKNDLVRDYMAVQAQALAELEKGQVPQVLRAQEVAINKDKQGSGQQDAKQQREDEPEYAWENDNELILLPAENSSTIDIRI
ncbi:MAG: hypothetical protein FWG43_05635 [Clostridiales bacterium]|nr:hypothetical protein [Clostridiales bacterium]